MTITFADLVHHDTAAWRLGAAEWRRLATGIEQPRCEVVDARAGLCAQWSGTAATAATGRVSGLRDRLAGTEIPLAQTRQLLDSLADRVDRARDLLLAAVAETAGSRVRVTEAGAVEFAAESGPPQPWEIALLVRCRERINGAVSAAARADGETAAALAELAAAAETGWTAPPPGCPPAGGALAVRLWWDGLTPAQRRWMIEREPDVIGRLDGCPAADRDLANRLWLTREHQRLVALRDVTPADSDERHRLEERLDGLAVLQARLDGAEPRAFLLGLDTRGDGKAIVALGDPDHADNVMTFVPGVGTNLDGGISGDLDRTATMRAAAMGADPQRSTSAIYWLGYDAPDNIREAISASWAHVARDGLHDFQAGLVATHDGEIGEQSVVGHSYGSLVIGETARDRGIDADDMVFLGSPGVGVQHAADLHVDPATVWSSTADHDIIQYAAPSLMEILRDLPIGRYYGDPMRDLWHGHNPSDDGFGGHVFTSAEGGAPLRAHSSYWDSGNPAMTSVGAIIAGHDSRVPTRP